MKEKNFPSKQVSRGKKDEKKKKKRGDLICFSRRTENRGVSLEMKRRKRPRVFYGARGVLRAGLGGDERGKKAIWLSCDREKKQSDDDHATSKKEKKREGGKRKKLIFFGGEKSFCLNCKGEAKKKKGKTILFHLRGFTCGPEEKERSPEPSTRKGRGGSFFPDSGRAAALFKEGKKSRVDRYAAPCKCRNEKKRRMGTFPSLGEGKKAGNDDRPQEKRGGGKKKKKGTFSW